MVGTHVFSHAFMFYESFKFVFKANIYPWNLIFSLIFHFDTKHLLRSTRSKRKLVLVTNFASSLRFNYLIQFVSGVED